MKENINLTEWSIYLSIYTIRETNVFTILQILKHPNGQLHHHTIVVVVSSSTSIQLHKSRDLPGTRQWA
jgi:hypothetical protein